jgi:hypothetical protein
MTQGYRRIYTTLTDATLTFPEVTGYHACQRLKPVSD